MTRIATSFIIVFFTVLIMGCGNTSSSEKEGESTVTEQAPAPAFEKLYPSLPTERMQELFNTAEYIDFVFYYTNFSMNQADKASIKATLSHVAVEVPEINPGCQPIGSIFFQSQGKELIQAESYFTDQCIYFIWLENGQRTYANKMTPNGFKFYEQVFAQNGAGN